MKIHLIGIGGIGVSALAQYYLSKGHKVSGSDLVASEITDFLKRVLLYIPNIFVAILILIVAALVAEFLGKFIRASMEAGRLSAARFIGSVAKWSVWVFALFAALLQLGVAPSLINIIITGFVAMIAIGGGLAFGLGGKDSAKEVLDKIKKDIS